MTEVNTLNYQRIAKAIEFINENFRSQPSLDEIAESVHLSPFHFQKIFTEWAGVSPKKFLQFTTCHIKRQLTIKYLPWFGYMVVQAGNLAKGILKAFNI